jgi:hypothetical protein
MSKKKKSAVKFRSMFEQNTAYWLDNNGINYVYEGKKLPYTSKVKSGICSVCGEPAIQKRFYLPDFYITDFGFYIETKGRLTSKDRSKMRDVVKANPKEDIRIVFMYDNKLEKNKDERYSSWASKNGFRYSVGKPSTDWFHANNLQQAPAV